MPFLAWRVYMERFSDTAICHSDGHHYTDGVSAREVVQKATRLGGGYWACRLQALCYWGGGRSSNRLQTPVASRLSACRLQAIVGSWGSILTSCLQAPFDSWGSYPATRPRSLLVPWGGFPISQFLAVLALRRLLRKSLAGSAQQACFQVFFGLGSPAAGRVAAQSLTRAYVAYRTAASCYTFTRLAERVWMENVPSRSESDPSIRRISNRRFMLHVYPSCRTGVNGKRAICRWWCRLAVNYQIIRVIINCQGNQSFERNEWK